jgi:DNA adenine methylase
MRKTFKGFAIDTVDINYTIGGGGKGKNRQELIIKNW